MASGTPSFLLKIMDSALDFQLPLSILCRDGGMRVSRILKVLRSSPLAFHL